MDKNQEAKSIFEGILTYLSKSVEKKEEIKEEAEAVELSETENEAVSEEVEVELSKEDNYITKEQFESYKTELSEVIKGFVEAVSKDKEELSQKVVELSAQPATEAISHSPEVKQETSKGFNYAANRPRGTVDAVLSQLSKYN